MSSVEESSRTINDDDFQLVDATTGSGFPVTVPWSTVEFSAGGGSGGANSDGTYIGDWLSVRHDNTRRTPDNLYVDTKDEGLNIPDCGARGNVVFCDGHADFVTREYVQSPLLRHWDPTW